MSEKKTLLEIVVMPVTLSLLGVLGAAYLTQQQTNYATQERLAQISDARALADAERQLKILELFADKITSPNPREQKLALQLLDVMDAELSKKLATALAQGNEQPLEMKRLAAEATARVSERRVLSQVYRVDDDAAHPITLRHSFGSSYEVEDSKWAWPWTGSVTLRGDSLLGTGAFLKSKATIRVRGKVQADDRIVVEYVFLTLDDGSAAKSSRTDKHTWHPLH